MARTNRLLLLAALAVSIAVPVAAQSFSEGYTFLKAVRERDGGKATQFVEAEGSTVVNYRDTDGDAAIHIVTRQRNYNWIGYLLQKGADPNLPGKDGDTALILAARIGFSEAADRLLAKGANVDKANKLGETPLIAAVQQRQPAMVRLLLEHGADSSKTDRVGYNARDYAKRETRFPEMLRLIESVKPAGAAKLKL